MQSKSKVAAGLFAIFLGHCGVHNFYLGNVGKAVLQLCLYWGGFVLLILSSILSLISPYLFFLPLLLSIPLLIIGCILTSGIGIWVLIEGIIILTSQEYCDARGIPLA